VYGITRTGNVCSLIDYAREVATHS
jgi:hypothetical protein